MAKKNKILEAGGAVSGIVGSSSKRDDDVKKGKKKKRRRNNNDEHNTSGDDIDHEQKQWSICIVFSQCSIIIAAADLSGHLTGVESTLLRRMVESADMSGASTSATVDTQATISTPNL